MTATLPSTRPMGPSSYFPDPGQGTLGCNAVDASRISVTTLSGDQAARASEIHPDPADLRITRKESAGQSGRAAPTERIDRVPLGVARGYSSATRSYRYVNMASRVGSRIMPASGLGKYSSRPGAKRLSRLSASAHGRRDNNGRI